MNPEKAKSSLVWSKTFSIPASGVVFASGGAMVGSAFGPVGSLVGAGVGALSGVFVEISSQKQHDKKSPKSGG